MTLTRGRATAVVALTALATLWLLASVLSAPVARAGGDGEGRVSGTGDTALYKAVVARVRAGESYYDAAGAELRARNYPVRPVFNWRQPTYAWLLSRLPSPLWGSAILVALGAAVVWSARGWFRAHAPGIPAWVVVALTSVTMAGAFVPDYVFLQEAWAGTLIALSVCLFGRDRWRAGVAAGLAALAFRELALLPCGVGFLLAVRRRRWPEVAAWSAGLAVYAALMAWHFAEVTRHYQPGDLQRGWFAFGSASFVVATARWNTLLLAFPAWAVALLLPLALLGFLGLRGPTFGRPMMIASGYVVAFAVVGNPFNDYWGSTYAPLLTFGFMGAPATIREIVRALRRRGPDRPAEPGARTPDP
jgi:hypothetical protein